GLLVPLTVAQTGWPMALLICGVVVCGITMMTWSLSPYLDYVPDRDASSSLRRRPQRQGFGRVLHPLRTLTAPLAALRRKPGLLQMASVGSLFAFAQSCWFAFTVVYLIDGLGYSLGLAGLVFSVMQIGAVI